MLRRPPRTTRPDTLFPYTTLFRASLFVTGLVNAIDFLHSTPDQPYPENQTCAGRYPTAVTSYNPFFDRIDRARLGVAGHSAGAFGASIVQGLDGDGAAPWFGKLDAHNPVKVVVAWDALSVGDAGAPISEGYLAVPRVPALSLMSEYVRSEEHTSELQSLMRI